MDRRRLADAERALQAGGIVGYPTDTLYGLGVLATRRSSVEALLELKGRAPSQPISVAYSSYEELEPHVTLDPLGRAYVRSHLPGPYTLLVRPSPRALEELAPPVARPTAALGVRIPDHPLARELARRVGPITATSANRHGEPAARTAAEARAVFGREVAEYLSDGPPPSGSPSTLVDLTGPTPRTVPRR